MLIARKEEQKILMEAYKSEYSSFIAVYGRRRIGKTFLVRETFNYNFTFSFSGIANEPKETQIKMFLKSIGKKGVSINEKCDNWLDAFGYLETLIEQSKEKKKVIFLDEFSWMAATTKTSFISALEYFWNSYASGRKDVLLIVSSSATSWLIDNVIHNKGGLYHRLTHTIELKPFTLKECKEFSDNCSLHMNERDVLETYMVFGGVPYYWSLLKGEFSVAQNVDNLIFSEKGELHNEFDYLYASLFKKPESYISIVNALGKKKMGLTREEIAALSNLANNGDLSKKLKELEEYGFIREYLPLKAKKKGSLFQLIDQYTLFYFHFLRKKPNDEHFFENNFRTSQINSWKGGAFERVCLLHTEQMKKALGISGVSTNICSYSFTNQENHKGHQIDLLIQRKDGVINLCEMKYGSKPYEIEKQEYEMYLARIDDFIKDVGSSYSIHFTLVTPYGLERNKYSNIVTNIITMEDLFL